MTSDVPPRCPPTTELSEANPGVRLQFMSRLVDHIDSPGTTRIVGTYRSQNVVHYLDPELRLNVFTTPEGAFWGAWRLGEQQLENVIERGTLA